MNPLWPSRQTPAELVSSDVLLLQFRSLVMALSSGRAATLLFCHGGGFCKDVWSPIIRRLQHSPLIQSVAAGVNMVTFDFPYHGPNRDVSQPATLHLENPTSPRVSHPAMNWGSWSPIEVQRQVRLLREREGSERTPLIGIGHSMGAAALWKVEGAAPGTFDGLVLFEPMVNVQDYPEREKSVDFLVSVALKRPGAWNSFEEAEADLLCSRNFARWDREALKEYIKGAVVKVGPENEVALSCHPHFEASLYCSGGLRLTDEEMANVKCPTTFQYGGRTYLFLPQYRQWLVEKYPNVYKIADPVPNTSHALVMEDPDTCTSRILEALERSTPFASA